MVAKKMGLQNIIQMKNSQSSQRILFSAPASDTCLPIVKDATTVEKNFLGVGITGMKSQKGRYLWHGPE